MMISMIKIKEIASENLKKYIIFHKEIIESYPVLYQIVYMSLNQPEYTSKKSENKDAPLKPEVQYSNKYHHKNEEKDSNDAKGCCERQDNSSQNLYTIGEKNISNPKKSAKNKSGGKSLSSYCKSQQSFSSPKNTKMLSRVDDSNIVSQHPRENLCSNCRLTSNSQYFQITNNNKDRIDQLQQKIKFLEKQFEGKNYNSVSFKDHGSQYFSGESSKAVSILEQQMKFIHKCVSMVEKSTNKKNPSLKYCWDFIRQCANKHRWDATSQKRQCRSSEASSQKYGIILSNLKNLLQLKRKQQISKTVVQMTINLQIHQRIFSKVKKLLNVKQQSPSGLLKYLESKQKTVQKEKVRNR